MPSTVTKKSVAIDDDLIGPALERSRKYKRNRKPNLSAYVNDLLRRDLGIDVPDPNSIPEKKADGITDEEIDRIRKARR